MKSLAELERVDARAAFIDSAVQLMDEKSALSERKQEIGKNDGPCQAGEIAAWFENARW